MAILCLLFLTQLDPELHSKKDLSVFNNLSDNTADHTPKENSSQSLTWVPFLKASFR